MKLPDWWHSDWDLVLNWEEWSRRQYKIDDIVTPYMADRLRVRAQVCSGKHLKLEFSKSIQTACYSQKTESIVLSNEPKGDDVRDKVKTLYGMVLHEAGHARFSNTSLLPANIKQNPRLFGLYNYLEDSRIENLMANIYPGTIGLFRHINKAYVPEPRKGCGISDYILYFAKHGRYPPEHHDAYTQRVLEKIYPFVSKARIAKSSGEVGQISLKVINIIDSEFSHEENFWSPWVHDFILNKGDGDVPESIQNIMEGKDGIKDGVENKSLDAEIEKTIQHGLDNLEDLKKRYPAGKDANRILSSNLDVITEFVLRGDSRLYQSMMFNLRPTVRTLTKEFRELMVISNGLQRAKRGRVHSNSLWRYPIYGDERVFQEQVPERTHDLHVLLLMDRSGSMNSPFRGKNKCIVAREAVATIHEALMSVGIPHAIVAFSADNVDDKVCVNQQIYKRFEDNETCTGLTSLLPGGNNRDGPSIRLAARYFPPGISHRIMIVLSDGQPAANGYGEKVAIADTIKAIKESQNMGIRVFGIGIDFVHDEIGRAYDDYASIDTPRDLLNKISKMIKREIQ